MIFEKNFARNYEKKIILGTSDAWSIRRSSHQPIDPAYYIEDCQILVQKVIGPEFELSRM